MKPLTNKPKKRKIRKLVTRRLERKWQKMQSKMLLLESQIIGRSPLNTKLVSNTSNIQTHRPIRELLDDWLASKKGCSSVSDQRNAALAAKWFNQFAGERLLAKQVVAEFASYLCSQRDYSQNTCCLMGIKVREFIRWLNTNGMSSGNEALGVKWPSFAKQVARPIYTEKEYERLLSANEGYNIEWPIMLMWHTGMSATDCCNLKWGDVDLKDCFVKRRRTKTGVLSRISFTRGGAFHRELQRMRKECEETIGNVTDETPVSSAWAMNTHTIRSGLRDACIRAGIKYRSPHSFRSTFITNLVERNVHPTIAMAMTGHTNPIVFSRYATVSNEQIRESLQGGGA
jgi:integrase